MKRIFFTLVISLFAITSYAQNRAINFEEASFNDAHRKAMQSGKILFIDCYTTWCGPCKMLAKDVFTNDAVADYFNANFVSLKLDCEKGDGIEVAKKFSVSGYPTLLFIDKNMNVVHKIVGASSPEVFLEKVKEGFDDKKSLSSKVKRYEAGEVDIDFLYDLFKSYCAINESKKAAEVGNKLLSLVPKSDLFTKDMWEIVSYYRISRYDNDWWKFMLDNDEKYISIVGKEVFSRKIGSTMHPHTFGFITGSRSTKSKDDFKQFKEIVDKYNPDNKDIIYSFLRMGKSRNFDKFNTFFKILIDEYNNKLDLGEHYRVMFNIIDYLAQNVSPKQKKQLIETLNKSQAQQNEYMSSHYDKFYEKLK